jgi:serine-type D-Ala-D-Ala carboxypeptidase/endopeptidase
MTPARSSLAAFVAAFALAILGLAAPVFAQDARGDWHGVLHVTPTVDARVVVHIRPTAGGGLEGALDSLDQGLYDTPIDDVTAKDGQLSFSYPIARATFAGRWDASAGGWKGVWSQGRGQLPLTLMPGDLPPAPTVAGLDGEWDGALNLGVGLALRLAFHIASGPHGTLVTMDSVDQGAYGTPASAISRDAAKVTLEMKAIGAVYVAQLSDDGQRLSGVFTQGGQPIPLALKRLAPGQPSPWPRPAVAAGPTPALPADWKPPSDDEIRALLVQRIDVEHQGVGIVVGVVEPGYTRIVAYGKSEAPDGRLDGDTEFEIGSITKVFTALALVDLAQKGALKLDDPIDKFLPPSVKAPTKDGKSITLVDLATNTSGLPRLPTNFAPKDPANPYADYSMDQLWTFLSSYQLPRDPGASWEYSNLGFGLLGDLLVRRAGADFDFEILLKTLVTGPLGMKSTTVTLTREERARLAVGHDSLLRRVPGWDLPTLEGAGALRSTANDLMRLLAAEMGAQSSLKSAMAVTLSTRRPTVSPAMEAALGWEMLKLPTGEIIEHGGGTGGYHTYVAFNPKTRVGVVVLTNAETINGGDDLALHILTGAPVLHLQPPPPPPPEHHAITLDAKALDALVGVYQLAPGATVTVTRDGPHLMAKVTGQDAYEVFPESPTRVFWKIVDAEADFTLGPDGRATSLTLHQGGRDLPAPRVP